MLETKGANTVHRMAQRSAMWRRDGGMAAVGGEIKCQQVKRWGASKVPITAAPSSPLKSEKCLMGQKWSTWHFL